MASTQLQRVLQDSCGSAVHCKSQDALDCFNKGVLQYVRSYGDCMASFNKALQLDSEFLLVNCALVRRNFVKLSVTILYFTCPLRIL